MTDPFDSVKSVLGKHRFGPLSNTELTRAIMSAMKRAEEIDRQRCGHDVSYYFEGECGVCKTVGENSEERSNES